MTPMRPGAAGSTTTPGTADMTDDTHDDSRPLPGPLNEATSAADADWLAELRATAKARKTSLADVVAELETEADADADPETEANDKTDAGRDEDELTIGSPTALEDVRRVARQERERATAHRNDVDVDADTKPPTSPVSSSRPARSTPLDAGFRPAVRPDTPSAPPVLRTGRPDLRSDRTEPSRKADQVVPRWEAPPRLEAAAESSEPAFLDRSGSSGRPDWRITALAVTAALLLGIVLSLLFLNNDAPVDPLDEDPDNTTVVDSSDATDTEQPEDGS